MKDLARWRASRGAPAGARSRPRPMPPRAVVAWVVAPLALAPSAALAQSSSATLETTVVTATRTERAALDVPASVDVIERSDVRDAQWRVNLSESLAASPGSSP